MTSRFEKIWQDKLRAKQLSVSKALEEIKGLESELPRGVRIIIYGSAARGEVGLHSDVDILVDAPTPMEAMPILDGVGSILSRHGIPMDGRWIGYAADRLLEMSKQDWIVVEKRE